MKTIQLKLYEFTELSDEAKEKAREWRRRASEGDAYWSESIIEEAVQQGELLGITFKTQRGTKSKPCIWWRGFWSQGDGACFEGSWRAKDCQPDKVAEGWGDAPETTDIKRIASEFGRIAKEYPHACFSVEHSGHYSHENCTEFSFDIAPDVDGDNQDISEENLDSAECALEDAAKDFMRWIYRSLEKEYEWQMSDEVVDENIIANEHLFESDGTRSRHE